MEKKPYPSELQPRFIIRLPDGMREQIFEAAKKHGRSMNAEVVQRLEHSFTPWQERPWEERMVLDVDRAMLKLLTQEEYALLFERVKAAGGADVVNGYASTTGRSVEDQKLPIPNGPRLTDPAPAVPPELAYKLEMGDELALAVLEMIEKNDPDEESREQKRKVRQALRKKVQAAREGRATTPAEKADWAEMVKYLAEDSADETVAATKRTPRTGKPKDTK